MSYRKGSADQISVADPGDRFAGDDVETVLAEISDAVGVGVSGAPTNATYLTATAHAGLSNEIPVGASPGGELSGPWSAPTVDAVHSGSSHVDVLAAAGNAANAALDAHLVDTLDAHDATAISVADAGNRFTATQVEGVLAEIKDAIPTDFGGTASLLATLVSFSTLTGATDSLKLAAFCTAYSGAAKKPTLVLDELRDYTFTTQQQIYSGFRMMGGGFGPVDEVSSALSCPQVVKIRTTTGTGWLTFPNATVIGVMIQGLACQGTTNVATRMFAPNPSATLQDCFFRDITYTIGPGVMGSPAQSQGIRGCTFDGIWNLNNIQDEVNGSAFNVGGSDNFFAMSSMLLDTGADGNMDGTGCLLRFSSLSKTTIRNLYLTADAHMAIQVNGGTSDQMSFLKDSMIEGRNKDEPSYGRLIGVSMDFSISDCWISFAMSLPGSANGGSGANQGAIHIDDGVVLVKGCMYRNATTVATTVPFIYATTGCTYLRVSDCLGTDPSDNRFKPVVKIPSSWVAGVNYDVDNSVTVVTY